MTEHPYRSPLHGPERLPPGPGNDRAAPFLVAFVWLSSLLRLALSVRHDEHFGFQPALALALTLLTPILALRAVWRARGE